MDAEIFPVMAKMEQTHWWFVSRRAIVGRMIEKLKLPPGCAILEPGCGTGGNLAMLAKFGHVHGMELDDGARAFAIQRAIGEILPGRLPEQIPFGEKEFDLIVLTDVLEHLDDDNGSLQALSRRLKPGGKLVMTVPACPFLWSKHDTSHHHKRRYMKPGLRQVIEGAGLRVQMLSYYNFLLFPLIATTRYVKKWTGERESDLGMPSSPVNWVLKKIFSSERFALAHSIPFPIGVSLIAVLQRPE